MYDLMLEDYDKKIPINEEISILLAKTFYNDKTFCFPRSITYKISNYRHKSQLWHIRKCSY